MEVTFMAERLISSNESWIHWVINDCNESSIPYALRYFEAHKQHLENLLEGYLVFDRSLTLRLSEQGGSRGWHLHAILTLPTGIVAAEGRDETLMGTMDRALDTLRADLKRHLRQTSGALLSPAVPQQEFLQPGSPGNMMAVAMA
jgi:ribosome-associated translation inhibitor RaiA